MANPSILTIVFLPNTCQERVDVRSTTNCKTLSTLSMKPCSITDPIPVGESSDDNDDHTKTIRNTAFLSN